MQLSDLQSRVSSRVGDDPNAAVANQYYTANEITAAINAAQRLFVLATLCLENTGTLAIGGNVAFYSLLGTFSQWLLPLRIRVAGGGKLKPGRLSDFAALDASWSLTTGIPDRYALLGFDFLAIYKVPATSMSLDVTYARCPTPLVASSDVPEIPLEYHPALIDGAIPLLRAKEGGQDWQKTLSYWTRFEDAMEKLGAHVRKRNKEQGYDYFPQELQRMDLSKLMKEAA